MAEMKNWLKNAAKSMGYGFKDAVKSYNPVLSEMIKDTIDTKDSIFSDISDIKSTFSLSEERTLVGELKESTKDIFKNLLDDIKTGNLYNKDRESAMDDMMMAAMGLDMSGFEDFDFDDWGDDDWTADDSAKAEVQQSVKNTAATIKGMDFIGEKISTSVSTATVESGKYIANVTRNGNKALYALNSKGFNNVSRALMQVNDNIVSFAKVTEPMTQHFNNATIFFTKTTETLEKIEKHLENMDSPKRDGFSGDMTGTINDIMSIDTGLSVSGFYNMIKENFKNDAWIMDSVKEGLENIKKYKKGNSYGDNLPVGVWITQAVTRAMIPKIIGTAMKEMNESLKDFSVASILNLRDSDWLRKKDEDLGILSYIIPKTNTKTKIDTGAYEKGKVSWDGISRKALTEVIPEYLSMIYGSISGNYKKYDYSTGKFISVKGINKAIEERKLREARFAGGNYDGFYKDAMDIATSKTINGKKLTKEEAEKLLDNYFMKAVFGSDEERRLAFKVNNGNFGEEERKALGIDEQTLEILQRTIDNYIKIMNKPFGARTAEEKKMARHYNQARVNTEAARNDYGNRINYEESLGTSLMAYVQNGSDLGLTKKGNKTKVNSLFSNMHDSLTDIANTLKTTIPNYLQLMLYELNGHTNYMVWNGKKMKPYDKAKFYKDNGSVVNIIQGSTKSKEKKSKKNKNNEQSGGESSGSSSDSSDAAPEQEIDNGEDIGEEFNIENFLPDKLKNGSSKDSAEEKKEKSKFRKLLYDVGGKAKKFLSKWTSEDTGKTGKVFTGIAHILDSVSYSINTLFMGTDEKDRKNGLLNVLKVEIKNIFSGFTKFYENFLKDHIDTIGTVISDRINGIFDSNEKFTDLKDRAKDFFRDVKDQVADWMGGSIGDIFYGNKGSRINQYDRRMVRYKEDVAKYKKLVENIMAQSTDEHHISKKEAQRIASQQIFGTDNPTSAKPFNPETSKSSAQSFAYGTNYVPKTGLAILSEGEMVIPTELNPFYNRPTNKANQIAKEKNIEKKYFGRYAEGSKGVRYKAYKYYKKKGLSIKEIAELLNDKDDEAILEGISEDKINTTMKEKEYGGLMGIMYPFLARRADKAGRFVEKKVQNMLDPKDKDPKKEENELRTKMLDITQAVLAKDADERKKSAVGAGAGALLGVGASVVSGALFGPIFGAALGAGLGLTMNSVKVQQAIFGEDVIDENGELKPEANPEKTKTKIAKFMKQQLPDTLKGAGAGALAGGLLGHPIIGAMIGGSIGFVKNSEKAQEALFGKKDDAGNRDESGLIPTKVQAFLKKGLPKALIGGAAGMILGGPFGMVGNILLGSSLGLYTETESFKNSFFGKEGDEESQKNSFIGNVKTKILDNVDELAHNAKNLLTTMFKSLGIGLKDKLKTFGNWLRDKLDNPKSGLGKILTAPFRLGGKLARGAVNLASMPLKFLNNRAQNANLRLGADVYSKALGRNRTAAERNALRRSRGIGSNKFSQFDSLLESLDKDQFNEIESSLGRMRSGEEDKNKIIAELKEKFKGDETKQELIEKIFRSKDGRGFASNSDLQKMIDLAKTEKNTVDWESKTAQETKEYQHTVIDVITSIGSDLHTLVHGGKGSQSTGKLKEGIEEYTDANGNKHFGIANYELNEGVREVTNKDGTKSYYNDNYLREGYRTKIISKGKNKGKRVYLDEKGKQVDPRKAVGKSITADEAFKKNYTDVAPEDAFEMENVQGLQQILPKLGKGLYKGATTAIAAPFVIGATGINKAIDIAGNGITNIGLNASYLKGEELNNKLYGDLVKQGRVNEIEKYNNALTAKREGFVPEAKILGLDSALLNSLMEKLIHALEKNTDATKDNTKAENNDSKNHLKEALESGATPATAARGGIFHASRIPFAGNFSGLPYWGNYGLGDIVTGIGNFASNAWNGVKNTASNAWNGAKNLASGAWNGIKNIGSGIWNGIKTVGGAALGIGAGLAAGNMIGNGISGVVNRVRGGNGAGAMGGGDINVAGGPGGGGSAGGESMETETAQGNKVRTVFDMFASPHQYIQKPDGELEEVKNDKETDASNSALGAFNSSISTVPVISSILAGISRTLNSIAGRVGTGGSGSGEGGSGNGTGSGGIGNALTTAAGAAGAGGLLASAKALVSNIAAPAAGIALASGAMDKAGEWLGDNIGALKGNDTKSVFSGQSIFVGGQQIQTDSHGKPIVDENGNYRTIDGNFINSETGDMTDSMGQSLGSVDTNDVRQYGSDNTFKTLSWKNLATQTIMNSTKGAGLSRNIISGFASGKSVLGSLMNGRMAQNAGHAIFGGTIKPGFLGRLGGKAPYQVQGIIPGIRNLGSRALSGIKNSRIAQGISNIGSNIAESDALKKVLSKLDDIFAKITKAATDRGFANLLPSNIKSNIGKFFSQLKDEIGTYLGKYVSAAKNGLSSLAKQLDDVLVALKIPLLVTAFMTGWGNAPTYLGVVTPINKLSFGQKFTAAAINALNQAIPFIGGLIPTKVFYNIFFTVAHLIFGNSGWEWLDNWAKEREESNAIVQAYNQENHCQLSIEEYNEIMGNSSAITATAHAWSNDVNTLKNTLSSEVKNEGVLGTIGNIGKGFIQTVKDEGVGNMALNTLNESFIAQGMRGVNNRLNNAVDEGVANGNLAARAYDKAMTGVGNVIVGAGDALDKAGDTAKDVYNTVSSWAPWNWGKGSGLPVGRGSGTGEFISQVDPRYSGIKVGKSSVSENGCAPAVASMVADGYGKKLSMQAASSKASKYQQGQDGTNVNYFGETLAEQGIDTGVLPSIKHIIGSLSSGNSVILLGKDANNSSKDNSPFGPTNHYVLASGLDEKGNIIIKDPENNRPVSYDPSILRSANMAIGTSRKVARGQAIRNTASRIRNAGKNLLNGVRGFLGGKGSKGQAFHAEIWSWLHQNVGLDDVQTAGAMGCFECESGNTPYCIEGYYLNGFTGYDSVSTNEGLDNFTLNVLFPAYAKSGISIKKDAYKGSDGHYYPGIGLAQWTGPRAYKLYKFTLDHNKNWYDLETQLDYLKSEFTSSYAGTISKLKNATTIEDATEIFAVGFEHGGLKKGTNGYNKRLDAARSIFSQYSNTPLADVSSLPSSDYTGTSSTSSTIGKVAGAALGVGALASGLSSIISGDGNILDKINSIFSTALGAAFGVGALTGGNEGGTYDENGNYIGGNIDLGALSNLDGPNKLVELAKTQLGYQEKASNSQLDEPNANVGTANYTKYGAFTGTNGQPWCGSFVSWLFDQITGGDKDKMKTLLRANDSDNIPRSLAAVNQYLTIAKREGNFTNTPQKGDIVIYKNDTSHTGIVSDVNPDGTFNTIEGNTSGTPEGFNRDGGIVAAKTNRPLSYSKLTGFLRPNWDAVFPPTGQTSTTSTSTSEDKDQFYTEPGSTYIDIGKFKTKLPNDRIDYMQSKGTLYEYALKNEPQAIGYVNKNILASNSSSLFPNMPTEAIKGTIASKISNNSLGSFVHSKLPSAIGFIDSNKITPRGGMPQNAFNSEVARYKANGDYGRWALSNYPDAVTYAGKGSGISGYVARDRAAKALNGWVKPVVNTSTSGSVSRTYNRTAGGASSIAPSAQATRVNTTAIAGIARNIANNSKQNNVNYEDLLVAIIKLLNSIAENTGAAGSLYTILAKYLPEGSNVSKEDIESLAKLSTAALATSANAKAEANASRNSGNVYNADRGMVKLRGDLGRIQTMR